MDCSTLLQEKKVNSFFSPLHAIINQTRSGNCNMQHKGVPNEILQNLWNRKRRYQQVLY